MTWSIRTRLTAWYLAIVVLVLIIGAITGTLVQRHRAVDRLDEDLDRTLATLVAVMRNEFGEGMDVAGATSEASQEVVAPGRSLAIIAASGRLQAAWGAPLPAAAVSGLPSAPERETTGAGPVAVRVRRQFIDAGPGRQFTAVVGASLADVQFQQTEMARAMALGVACALLIAGVGGWLIGRRTLAPLAVMADQAQRVDVNDPRGRLDVPRADLEIGQLASAFNGLLDRLTTALGQQRQFMADASHELRTPVSVIRTTAQVMVSRDDRALAEYRDAFGVVAEQASRLSRLVDDMFLLSRAEANGVFLREEFVELDEIAAESVRALRVRAEQRGVTVTVGGAQQVGLTADGALLTRLVTNLLDNAIRHAAPRGHVEVDVQSVGGHATVRISNDGAAIAPEDRARIFDRFVRVGPSEGAGLGLPIARWIAEAHHGRLELVVSDGHRTTFAVTVPLDAAAS